MKKSFVIILAFLFVFAVFFSYAATWNADKPAVGNQISEDIPDIEENFQELHDVVTAITNGTLGTTAPGDFEVDAVAINGYRSLLGYTQRAQFTKKDDDEIYLAAGSYEVDGKWAQWTSTLTKQISANANTWYYFYLDYSEITSGTAITATEIIAVSTAPTWSVSKHGWYNGSDRCIFAVRTDADSDILEFFHNGDRVYYAESISAYNDDVDTTFIDVTLSIPAFSQIALVYFYLDANGDVANASAAWRINGQTSSSGQHLIGVVVSTSIAEVSGGVLVMTDTSQKIEVHYSAAGDHRLTIATEGWGFPVGM